MGIDYYYVPVKGNETVVYVLIRNDNQEIFSEKKKNQCSK